MVTFTINIPQMLAYIPYMDPMGMDFHWFSPVLSLHLSHYLLFPYFFHDFPIEKTPFSIIFPFTLRTSTRGLGTKTKGETHGKWMICSHGGFLPYTLWLFNIAMENDPFTDDFPIKTSIFNEFSIAMLNNKRVSLLYLEGFWSVPRNPPFQWFT